jgi:hypothetical protein
MSGQGGSLREVEIVGRNVAGFRTEYLVKDIWGSKSVAWSIWTLEGGREGKKSPVTQEVHQGVRGQDME